MILKQGAIFFLFLHLSMLLYAQRTEIVNAGGPAMIAISDQLPEGLSSERSVVIISVPSQADGAFSIRGDWKKLAMTCHKFFRKIGVDPIAYIHQADLNAGPEVNAAYLRLFAARRVENLILIRQEGDFPDQVYTMTITGFAGDTFVKNGQPGWQESHPEVERIMVWAGRQVLRQQLKRSNLLIPEYPEYLQDLAIFEGTRLESYPSRLQSLKLAVVAFQSVPLDNTLDAEAAEKIAAYNRSVDEKNETLRQIMSSYPFKYDLVTQTSEDELYKAGYQYALMPLSSTGGGIKQILNYATAPSETHYITNSFDAEGKVVLKRIPVNANVTKYYVKQTIVHDIHPGKVWDADVSWELALQNFIFNLNRAFK